uniref:Uncharacterized protein n=1 Tax=Glossina austeni TaxID=7395 RepID=A0A1A9V305_GLOAU
MAKNGPGSFQGYNNKVVVPASAIITVRVTAPAETTTTNRTIKSRIKKSSSYGSDDEDSADQAFATYIFIYIYIHYITISFKVVLSLLVSPQSAHAALKYFAYE